MTLLCAGSMSCEHPAQKVGPVHRSREPVDRSHGSRKLPKYARFRTAHPLLLCAAATMGSALPGPGLLGRSWPDGDCEIRTSDGGRLRTCIRRSTPIGADSRNKSATVSRTRAYSFNPALRRPSVCLLSIRILPTRLGSPRRQGRPAFRRSSGARAKSSGLRRSSHPGMSCIARSTVRSGVTRRISRTAVWASSWRPSRS